MPTLFYSSKEVVQRFFYKLYDLVLKTDHHNMIKILEKELSYMLCNALLHYSPIMPLLKKHVLENPTMDCVLRSFMVSSQKAQVALSGLQVQFPYAAPIQDELLEECLKISQNNVLK